jgi:hypothetical protein
MPHELSIRVREFFETGAKRIAARFQQASPLDGVLRQHVDGRVTQLRAHAALLAPEPVNLVVCDHAHPFHKVGSELKRLVFSPQHDAYFLKHFFRVSRAAQERNEIGEKPAVVLGKEPRERVTPLMIGPIWIPLTFHDNSPDQRFG